MAVVSGNTRTLSSPNIRQSASSDSASGATTAFTARGRGFPSTPCVASPGPSDALPPANSINSITNIFPNPLAHHHVVITYNRFARIMEEAKLLSKHYEETLGLE